MNICFFHGGFAQHGGIGRVVSILANGMAKKSGYSVYSLSFYKCGEEKAYVIDPMVREDYLYDEARSMTKAMLTDGVWKLCHYIRKNSYYISYSIVLTHIVSSRNVRRKESEKRTVPRQVG